MKNRVIEKIELQIKIVTEKIDVQRAFLAKIALDNESSVSFIQKHVSILSDFYAQKQALEAMLLNLKSTL